MWSDSLTALGQNWKHLALSRPKQSTSSKQLPRRPLMYRGRVGRMLPLLSVWFSELFKYFVINSHDQVSLNQEKKSSSNSRQKVIQLSQSSCYKHYFRTKNVLLMGWMGCKYQPLPVLAHRIGPLLSLPWRLELTVPVLVAMNWVVHHQNISHNQRWPHATLRDHTDVHWKYICSCETMFGFYTQRNHSIPRDQLNYLINPFTLIHLPSLSIKSLSITIIFNYS